MFPKSCATLAGTRSMVAPVRVRCPLATRSGGFGWIIRVEYAGEKVASVETGTRAAARRANLPGVTPHILRHTAATRMALAGVPMIEIARMLGHRDSRIAERVYAKHSPDYLRRAVDALSA